jgi:hypothetical protein
MSIRTDRLANDSGVLRGTTARPRGRKFRDPLLASHEWGDQAGGDQVPEVRVCAEAF